MKTLICIPVAILLALVGCRADPGASDYESQEPFDRGTDVTGDAVADVLSEPDVPRVLPGPDPWEPGEDRLTFGLFYEGGSSDAIIIDDTVNFLFIFPDGALSIQSSNDRIEGLSSDQIGLNGGDFWGLGIFWRVDGPESAPRPEDLSFWETLHISFKSSDAVFADVTITLADASGATDLMASDYGYANDGEWHTLDIPLSDFVEAGLDLSTVNSPLALGGGTNTDGAALLVDNFYYTTP